MILSLMVGLIFYLAANHMVLAAKGISLTDYQNISRIGQTNLKMLLHGILLAWKNFIFPVQGGTADMYMQSIRMLYFVTLAFSICLLVWHIAQCGRREKTSLFFLLGGVFAFPVGINLFYLMGDIAGIHSIMVYAKVMVFIFPVVLIERLGSDVEKVRRYSMLCFSVLLLYVTVFYTHYANVCYLQAEFQQSEAISWMASLATKIESAEGYSKELPIAYLNEGNMPDTSNRLTNEFSTGIIPYGSTWMYSRWKISLYRWCGFRHEEVADLTGIESLPEVQGMPAYPAAGSIRVVNGVIVVKF